VEWQSTDVLFVLRGFRLVSRFHEGHTICHHTPPEAFRLGCPLMVTFFNGLDKAIEPQVIQMRRNVEVFLISG
jgi:hypothetical protein